MKNIYGYSEEYIGFPYSTELGKHVPTSVLNFDNGCSIEQLGSPTYFYAFYPRICIRLGTITLDDMKRYSMLNWDNNKQDYTLIPLIQFPQHVEFHHYLKTFMDEETRHLVHYFVDMKTKELWTIVDNAFKKVDDTTKLRELSYYIKTDVSEVGISMSNDVYEPELEPEYNFISVNPWKYPKDEILFFKWIDSEENSHIIKMN